MLLYHLKMSEFAWICLNKCGSEYASGPIYAKILNMAKFLNMAEFSTCQSCTAFWIYQDILWQSSEYVEVTQGSEYATIWLNMSAQHMNMSEFTIIERLWICIIIRSARSLCRLPSTYCTMGESRTLSMI